MITNTPSSPSPLSSSPLYGTQDNHLHWLTNRIAIHQGMLSAWQKMQHAALQDNIVLHIASGWRSFERQLQLWNNKFNGQSVIKNIKGESIDITTLNDNEKVNAILLYSALPGASRHHWGTDIDVYAPNLLPNEQALTLEPWEYQNTGPLAPLSDWLKRYSQDFGFYHPYDCFRGGIASEPWHLSYQPLAKIYQQQFSVISLTALLNATDILGKEAIVNNIDEIYRKFIRNINPSN